MSEHDALVAELERDAESWMMSLNLEPHVRIGDIDGGVRRTVALLRDAAAALRTPREQDAATWEEWEQARNDFESAVADHDFGSEERDAAARERLDALYRSALGATADGVSDTSGVGV
jgi:hypothetical protein